MNYSRTEDRFLKTIISQAVARKGRPRPQEQLSNTTQNHFTRSSKIRTAFLNKTLQCGPKCANILLQQICFSVKCILLPSKLSDRVSL